MQMTFYNPQSTNFEAFSKIPNGEVRLRYTPAPANYTPPPPLWFAAAQIDLELNSAGIYTFTDSLESAIKARLFSHLDMYLRKAALIVEPAPQGVILTSPYPRAHKRIDVGLCYFDTPRHYYTSTQSFGNIHADILFNGVRYRPFIMKNPYTFNSRKPS